MLTPSPQDSGRKLNVLRTFRKRPMRLLNVRSIGVLCPVTMRSLLAKWIIGITKWIKQQLFTSHFEPFFRLAFSSNQVFMTSLDQLAR